MEDNSLLLMFEQLGIQPQVETKLYFNHQITNYDALKAKKKELYDGTLDQVDEATQKILSVALAYLESLKHSTGDPLPYFSKKEWRDFAIKHGSSVDNGTSFAVSNGSGEDMMELDGIDDDDEKLPARQRSKKDKAKKDVLTKQDSSTKEKKEVKLGKFQLLDQGFNPSESLPAFENLDAKPSTILQSSSLLFVDFNDRRFNKGQCYYAKADTGAVIAVGIKSFKSKTEANCAMCVELTSTFLGNGDQSEDFLAAMHDFNNHCSYVQVKGTEVVHLSELGEACSAPHPASLPKTIYEPQAPGKWQSFAYTSDNGDRSNHVMVQRKEMRLVEAFAGAGGMHLGFEEEGYKTVTAIELDDAAVATFKHNNPDVPVYHGCVNEFTRKMETDPDFRASIGSIVAIHCSSPCQGFSKANRNGGKNDEINNGLSYTFVDHLRATNALVGTFENVEGMWTQKGMPYLRRMLIGCIRLGYQVRVMILRACDYGDPQERPRMIIFATKKFVPMPDRPEPTHGPGKQPYVTVKDTLGYLCTPTAKAQNYPNMGDHNTNDCKTTTKKGDNQECVMLDPYALAPTVLASGPPVFHYQEKGPDGNFRCLNVREIAALQSFPLDYEFLGTQTQRYKQAGNAVPVGLSRVIARTMRESLRHMYVEELRHGTQEADAMALADNLSGTEDVTDPEEAAGIMQEPELNGDQAPQPMEAQTPSTSDGHSEVAATEGAMAETGDPETKEGGSVAL